MSEDNNQQGYSAAAEVGNVKLRRSMFERAWIELRKAPLTAWFGLIVVILYLIMIVFADLIAPYGEAEVLAGSFMDPWTSENILGKDQIGRDVFSRLI